MSEAAREGPIRVMLIDDHASFRQPLAFMMGREPDLEVVAQAGSLAEAREALANAEELAVDVAVVDLELPDGSGVDFLDELHEARPRIATLVLSAHSEKELLARAIEAGAAGIMHKSARLEEIVGAVRRLEAGEPLLSQEELIEAVRLVSRKRREEREAELTIGRLTPRELEVLGALAEGLSDKEIAERLYVGVGTVRTHITSILSKLGVRSRLQALVFAARHGLVRIG